ncbi:hypothetical protein SAMN05216525_1595 [Bradyrhizobium sp. Gha]|nr:hypothetical protein SAMN05216525_1595 [Bradyrhizobium sp. Gha]
MLRHIPAALRACYDVAQNNFRKSYDQLSETRNLLLAALQLFLFVGHHRCCATTAIAEMMHEAPFPFQKKTRHSTKHSR